MAFVFLREQKVPGATGGVIGEGHRGHVEEEAPIVSIPTRLVEAIGGSREADAVASVEIAPGRADFPVAPLPGLLAPRGLLPRRERINPTILGGEEVARLVGSDGAVVGLGAPGDEDARRRCVNHLAEEVTALGRAGDLDESVRRQLRSPGRQDAHEPGKRQNQQAPNHCTSSCTGAIDSIPCGGREVNPLDRL